MNPPTNECNCRSHDKCPLDGKCLIKPIVYQATVTTNDNKPDQTYVGLTANAFKTRFTNHKASFTSAKKKYSTEFSKYIWQLKEKNIDHEIKWRILRRALVRTATPPTDATYVCGRNTIHHLQTYIKPP